MGILQLPQISEIEVKELHRELTFIHVLLSPSPNRNVLSLESQMYTSTRLFVANVAKSAA